MSFIFRLYCTFVIYHMILMLFAILREVVRRILKVWCIIKNLLLFLQQWTSTMTRPRRHSIYVYGEASICGWNGFISWSIPSIAMFKCTQRDNIGIWLALSDLRGVPRTPPGTPPPLELAPPPRGNPRSATDWVT